MVNHILFWIHALTGALGLTVIIISLLLYSKFREGPLIQYSVILILLGLLFLTEILELYSGIADITFFSPNSSINIFSYISVLFILSLLVPCFIVRFTGRNLKKKKTLLIIFPATIYTANLFLYFRDKSAFIVSDICDFLFFIIICSWIFYLLKRKPYLADYKHSGKVRILTVLILLFIPFFITDIIFPSERIYAYFDFVSIPFLVFYLIWNVLNLLFAYRLFFLPGDQSPPKKNLEAFASSFRLSDREKEVSSLIINGESNKAIAYNLQISERTVKNHIYNIFRKTEVQSRIELFVKLYNYGKSWNTTW